MDTISRLNDAAFALQAGSSLWILQADSRASFIKTSLVNIALQQREITETSIEREKGVNFAALLNGISDEETRAFIRNIVEQLLENDPAKTALNLWKPNIGSDGFSILLKALEKNDYLQLLRLSCGPLGDEDIAILAEVIKNKQSLQILDLSHNSISDKGAAMLAEALRGNQTLQSLNLSWNHIDDEGVKALVQALKGNRSLYFLNLSENDMHNAGEEALFKLLKRKLIVISHSPPNIKEGVGGMAGDSNVPGRGWGYFKITSRNVMFQLYHKKSVIEAITSELQDLKEKLYPLDEFFSVAIEPTSTHRSNCTGEVNEDFEAYVSCLHDLMEQITSLGFIVFDYLITARYYSWGYLNKHLKKEMESIPHNLQDLLLNEFEDILSAICSKYYHLYYKKDSALFNTSNFDLARDIYKFWKRIFGEKCPKWLDDKIDQLSTFYQLWALVEGRKEEPNVCLPPSLLFPILKEMSEKKRLPESLVQEVEEKKRRRLI